MKQMSSNKLSQINNMTHSENLMVNKKYFQLVKFKIEKILTLPN